MTQQECNNSSRLQGPSFWQDSNYLPTMASLSELSASDCQRLQSKLNIILSNQRQTKETLIAHFINTMSLAELFAFSQASNDIYEFVTHAAYQPGWQARFEVHHYMPHNDDTSCAFDRLMGAFLAYQYRYWEQAGRENETDACELYEASVRRGIKLNEETAALSMS